MQRIQTQDPVAFLGALTDRRLAELRLTLTTASAAIIYLIPWEPLGFTYYALGAYLVYSFAVYMAARKRINFSPAVMHTLVWVDLAWYTLLVSLNNGTNSLFFFFYLFAIIAASSRGGVGFGLLVTLVAVFLCLSVGFLAAPTSQFDRTRFVMRPLAIGGLGYILAYWGGAELALKRKMNLLNELAAAANPRFGVDWTIELILRRLLKFWDASYCLILLAHDTGLHLYLVSSEDSHCRNVLVKNQSDIPFIDISDSTSAIFSDHWMFGKRRPVYRSFDPRTNGVTQRPLPPGEALAEFLSAHSHVGVPLHYRERSRGRILVSSSRASAFDVGDAVFLQQVANQVLPVIENIRLVERLASDASEEERNRIARSVHDRVIQPYYGLQIGLKALHSVLQPGSSGGSQQPASGRRPAALLEELMVMTSEGIDELRQYVMGLKQSTNGEACLADSIRRYALKFESATGIHVKVVDDTGGFVGNGRLTSEVFQMAAEALSNVHRHTQARSARVALSLASDTIRLQVENEQGSNGAPAQFTPGSISDRAEALGGRTRVLSEEGRTVLTVEVPL